MKRVQKKLLGFRSGRPWKMVVALIWYFLSFIVLFFGMRTPLPIKVNSYDILIFRATVAVVFLWMLSPAIFLPNTFLNRCVPFFQHDKPLSSLTGMMIVFLFFVFLFATVNGLHSGEYNQLFENYFEEYIEKNYQMSMHIGNVKFAKGNGNTAFSIEINAQMTNRREHP